MPFNADVIVAFAALLVSAITALVGFMVLRGKAESSQVHNVHYELEQVRKEIDQLKQEVATYFRENMQLKQENLELHRRLDS